MGQAVRDTGNLRPSRRTHRSSCWQTDVPANTRSVTCCWAVNLSRWHDHRNVPPDRVRGAVSKQCFSPAIPGENDARRRVSDDGILGILYNGRQEPLCVLSRPALRYVLFDGNVADNFAIHAPHRSNAHLLGVNRSILAPVVYLAPPDSPGPDGVPEIFVKRHRVASRLEDARVPPQNFRAAVSRHRRERGIHILDGPARIGNDDAIPGLLHRGEQPGRVDDAIFQEHALSSMRSQPLCAYRPAGKSPLAQ